MTQKRTSSMYSHGVNVHATIINRWVYKPLASYSRCKSFYPISFSLIGRSRVSYQIDATKTSDYFDTPSSTELILAHVRQHCADSADDNFGSPIRIHFNPIQIMHFKIHSLEQEMYPKLMLIFYCLKCCSKCWSFN